MKELGDNTNLGGYVQIDDAYQGAFTVVSEDMERKESLLSLLPFQ